MMSFVKDLISVLFRLLRKALDKISEIKAIRENRRLGKFFSFLHPL